MSRLPVIPVLEAPVQEVPEAPAPEAPAQEAPVPEAARLRQRYPRRQRKALSSVAAAVAVLALAGTVVFTKKARS